MRVMSIFFAATALLATAVAAHAESGSTKLQRANTEHMYQIRGTYLLSDGRKVNLFLLHDRLYAQIAHDQRKEILQANQTQFASRDGTILIQFGPELDTSNIELVQAFGIVPQDAIRVAVNMRSDQGRAD
ncbi:hypothetical protein [Massilia aerilata]|uniref:Uncharacterized protein n=1 Tax=Massilia aerilata TaxID=453817 RepID=A0ABW0S6D8_9BURK